MCDWLRGINSDINIKYTVFETKQISSEYGQYSKEIGIDFRDINLLKDHKFDLIIISGTLQYTKDWEQIINTSLQNAPIVLLMRVPLIDSLKNEYFIQHFSTGLYGESSSSWPVIFFAKDKFIEKVKELSEIQFSGIDYEESFPFNGRKCYVSSYLLKSKLV